MGLDVVLLNKEGKEIHSLELSYEFHEAMFKSNFPWRKTVLKKIRDYYMADADYVGDSLALFIKELELMENRILSKYQDELRSIIMKVKDPEVSRVYVIGD
ncbi:hypothetical protein [Risungbinella massiliensis]|uniref:hypothetical protein n=1 Tax=Risungbinella massiliensis TaxID=1329796 RepID=UPI0005CBB137|nr:hypothetical protein [Risungbinella massiliensis]